MEKIQESSKTAVLEKPCTLWLTGLSGAGKSTLAEGLQKRLETMLCSDKVSFILDGDVIRRGLNKDLGFTAEDRAENIRRIAEVSKLFNLSGQICVTAFISPYAKERTLAKTLHDDNALKFFEVHVATPLEVCEQRDPKGLYKKARKGEIPRFTGISDPYEKPENPDLLMQTKDRSVDECIDEIVEFLV